MKLYEMSTEEIIEIEDWKGVVLTPSSYIGIKFEKYLEKFGLTLDKVMTSTKLHNAWIVKFNIFLTTLNLQHNETFVPVYGEDEPLDNKVESEYGLKNFTSDLKYLKGNISLRLKDILLDEVFDIINSSDSPHYQASLYDFRILFKE